MRRKRNSGHGGAVDGRTNARIARELGDRRMTTTYGRGGPRARRRNPTAQIEVIGQWPSQTIWLWHRAGVTRRDYLSISFIKGGSGTGIVRFSRRRGTIETTLNGSMSPSGDLSWTNMWINYSLPKSRRDIERVVDRASASIDFLLDVYYQQLVAGKYTVHDVPESASR